MKVASKELLADLIERTENCMTEAENLYTKSKEELNYKSSPHTWSILECIEHLNRYGDFYLPEIANRMAKSSALPAVNFYAGLLGDYFAKSMLPKEKPNKMKTFKDKNPNGLSLNKTSIERFLSQQKTLLELLHRAKGVNLNKTKTAISISKFIKLRLGDTFRVVVYHNQRHLVQVNNVLKQLPLSGL
ncbi:DinB family protein [uncultured Kriegella sp.]|uniref:DinB family protein n=1 Tax=uncultured Kriegella sp. TaxID=1798910 RepID=UPI0030D9EEE0|tara:strand:+ start:111700 stop:112263 length:564 start_codon:yes stop_codon:yes gene_type:complete